MPTSRSDLAGFILTVVMFLSGCAGGIFLSRTKIVSNSEYPGEQRNRIAALKASLSDQDALRLLRDSFGEEAVAEDSLRPPLAVTVNDRTHVENLGSVQRTTTYSHSEVRWVQVPFSDIKHIRVRTVQEKNGSQTVVDFTTPVTVLHSPYYGANLFALTVKPNADEAGLIASLLHFCVNLEDSSWASF